MGELTDSLLLELLAVNKLILKELQDGADEGKAIVSHGTVTTTDFVVIDTQISPGHSVKGFTIENTDVAGGNNIYVGMNIAVQPQLDIDIIDVTKIQSVFDVIVPNESFEFKFNRNTVKSVHLLAVAGSPTYKAWLVW